jgi:GTP-binding protein
MPAQEKNGAKTSRSGLTLKRRGLPIVAVVGRANVGKSTLWNRLTETGRALVSDVPHTTRDRNYAPVVWRGTSIEIVDTGGLDAEQGSAVGRGILRQAELAIREADLVLFLIDAKAGVGALDRDLARQVRSQNPHILLVANKADTAKDLGSAASKEIWALSLGEAVSCSAATGRGLGDLLDRVQEELSRLGKPALAVAEIIEEPLKIVIMGRPNVGKSSIVNSILGEERVIVSPLPHTTREPMDTSLEWRDEKVVLVDTAGMRKRARLDRGLEESALDRNREALVKADIAFLILDATEGVYDQDKHLAGLLKDEKKGLVIVMNKWDLVPDKKPETVGYFEEHIRRSLPFLWWAPVVFVSAKDNLRTSGLLDLAFRIRDERRRQIAYNALQRFLKTIIAKKRPFQESGPQSPYLHDVSQIGIEPPTFLITIRGQRGNLHESWLRFFENRLREKFGFTGTPLDIKARVSPLVRSDMPEKMKNRPTRRKKPIGRRVGRY